MKSLRRRYILLSLREHGIKRELREANRMPKLEVLQWLVAVDDVKKQVKQLEKSTAYNILSYFSIDGSGYSYVAKTLYKEIKKLLKSCRFPDGIFPKLRILVEQCPSRSQLFRTIWGSLMDPNVSIMSIYGDCGVGKTTAMMNVRNKLATSEMFNSIFWVTVSKLSRMQARRVYQLQTDLAQQMLLDLPEFGRADVLLEGLKKIRNFLIVIDGLCEELPLMMVGIPEPDRENRSKVVLISQDYSVCHIMKSDKIIKVDTFSSAEKWNVFASQSGDVVLAPDIIPIARQLVELCPGRPLLVNAVSYAMRDEVSIEVWRNTIEQLVGYNMVFNLLKICYQRLKDDTVQKCFLYCALFFPHDYFFRSEEVIRYWIDGNCINGDAVTAIKTDTGHNIIRKLLNAKMMEMSEKGEEDRFKVADMWRKWATNATEKEPELYLDTLCNPRRVKMASKEMEQPREIRIVAEDIFSIKKVNLEEDMLAFKTVKQCPKRPQLLDIIWENLMDPNVRVLSIYGSWGVGKTTAMTEINKRLAVTYDKFDSVIWATFSKASGLDQLQTDIALQMNLDLPEDGRAEKLLEGLEKIESFLIIIDDLTEFIPLMEVGIPVPSRNNRHKIVVISRAIQVCFFMRSDKIIEVGTFSLPEKWDLFVSKSSNTVLTPDIQSLAKQLVKLCPGRPLIINALSHAMRDEVSIQVWRNTLERLMSFEAEDMVFEVLKICYEGLKDDMMEKCFFYCALFPEDCQFNPEELVRYWMAESFIHGDEDIVTKRENGFKIMIKLLDANILEMSAKSEDDWLKMPYMWRDFAMRTMKGRPGFDMIRNNSGMVVEGKVSLMRSKIEVINILPLYISYNNVLTLLLRENPISKVHPSLFPTMNALQFLDLSYTSITELPSTVSEVAQLRVLFLHYCTRLEKIPSLQKLTKLEVLSLCGTSIVEVPHGLEGLVNLRSLDLSETAKLWHIQAGIISALFHLEELRLQGSGICKVDSPMVTNYLMEMRCLKRLEILSISTVCYGDLLDTIMFLQEHNLKIFFVNAYGTTEDCDEDV